eukprot:scaffold42716_cov161-Skeletonema_dohrnii-CCMP3373.AAC.3
MTTDLREMPRRTDYLLIATMLDGYFFSSDVRTFGIVRWFMVLMVMVDADGEVLAITAMKNFLFDFGFEHNQACYTSEVLRNTHCAVNEAAMAIA